MNDEASPRQGDYLPDVRTIHRTAADGRVEEVETPFGVLLMTQCCDLSQANGEAQVAKVVLLEENLAGLARSGRLPRYVGVAQSPPHFADLGVVAGIALDAVREQPRLATDASSRQIVREAIGRRYSRFAYPDKAHPALRAIMSKVRSKASSPNSPLHQVLRRVVRIRVELLEGSWEMGAPWTMNLLLILDDGELPTLPTDAAQTVGATLSEVAEQIAGLQPASGQLDALWWKFGQLLADEAMRADSEHVFEEITCEPIEEGELTYARFRRSTSLDIDDLSASFDD